MSYNKKDWHDLPNMSTPISANNLNHMEEGIADANGAIGVDAYDSTATYEVGDLCIYNNILYRCIIAIITAEAFDITHWTQITLLDKATSTSDGLMSSADKIALDNAIAITTGSINFTIGTASIEINRYTKIGKLCLLELVFKNSAIIQSSNATLQIGNNLPGSIYGNLQFFGGNYNGVQYRFQIDINGNLRAHYTGNDIPANSTIVINIMYITN